MARPVSGLRRKAVLAVLALRVGEIVSTDRLIDVVWSETSVTGMRRITYPVPLHATAPSRTASMPTQLWHRRIGTTFSNMPKTHCAAYPAPASLDGAGAMREATSTGIGCSKRFTPAF